MSAISNLKIPTWVWGVLLAAAILVLVVVLSQVNWQINYNTAGWIDPFCGTHPGCG